MLSLQHHSSAAKSLGSAAKLPGFRSQLCTLSLCGLGQTSSTDLRTVFWAINTRACTNTCLKMVSWGFKWNYPWTCFVKGTKTLATVRVTMRAREAGWCVRGPAEWDGWVLRTGGMIWKTEVGSLITQLLKSFLSLSFKYTGTALIDTPSAVMASFTHTGKQAEKGLWWKERSGFMFSSLTGYTRKHWKNIHMKTTAWELNIGLTL